MSHWTDDIFGKLPSLYKSQTRENFIRILDPRTKLSSVANLGKISMGLMESDPVYLENYFRSINLSLGDVVKRVLLPTPQPPAPGIDCQKLVRDFESGAQKIRNPLTGRLVERVDARGKPNKVIGPLLRDCGFITAQPPAPGIDCQKLVRDFESGAQKIRNPLTGRLVERVDARGKPNKVLEPLLKGCGFAAPVQKRGRKPKPRLVKSKDGKISLSLAKCQGFRRRILEKKKEAINPLTGRMIKLFNARGYKTATTINVLKACEKFK